MERFHGESFTLLQHNRAARLGQPGPGEPGDGGDIRCDLLQFRDIRVRKFRRTFISSGYGGHDHYSTRVTNYNVVVEPGGTGIVLLCEIEDQDIYLSIGDDT